MAQVLDLLHVALREGLQAVELAHHAREVVLELQNVADQTARAEQEGREATKLVEKMEQRLKVHQDEYAMVQSKYREEQEAKT
jgi:hypothetical protein